MKALLAKIRAILRDRRNRRLWGRIVSTIACMVVFVSTYALILPAITMEKTANCGIEAHQHNDECYSYELTCTIPESEGHIHDDSCYITHDVLSCQMEEHLHDDSCYDENGNLICGQTAHQHDRSCWQETTELICGFEETEGHTHTEACYKKVLTCNKEEHVHSAGCYKMGDREVTGTAATDAQGVMIDADNSGAAGTNGEYSTEDLTVDPAQTGLTTEAAAGGDTYVPILDELDFNRILNNNTGIYYYHPDDRDNSAASVDNTAADSGMDGQTPETGTTVENDKTREIHSAEIPAEAWQIINKKTVLGENDILRVYFSYSIPAGSLNQTNDIARYRLPANLHISDEQIEAINKTENGIASAFIDYETLTVTDPDSYNKYLGVEAIEGTRRPDELPAGDAQEFISAVVRVENVYDTEGLYGEKDALLGQDLVFTFVPYTVQKNQHTYDAKGNPVSAGETVEGWLTMDLTLDQIDFQTVSGSDIREADIIFVDIFEEASQGIDIEEISTKLVLENTSGENLDEGSSDADDTGHEEDADGTDDFENADGTDGAGNADDSDSTDNINRSEKENLAETDADTDKVNYPARFFQDSIIVRMGGLSTDTAAAAAGSVTSSDVSADAEAGHSSDAGSSAAADIQDRTELTVRVEAEEGTFPEGTTMILAAVTGSDLDTVAEAVEGAVEGRTQGFHAVDITFRDANGNEIEPLKPIKVSMQSESIRQAVENPSTAPVVVHVEDKKARDDTNEEDKADRTDKADEADKADNTNRAAATVPGSVENDNLTFESDAFSVYAIVYTVDFLWEVNGKEYEFSFCGGDSISFRTLASMFIAPEELDSFMADIKSMELSDPSLIWAGQIDADMTAAEITDRYGLEVEYSGELTRKDIEMFRAKSYSAGDWVLAGIRPFDTEEMLTVTMKDGEVFTMLITDDQDPLGLNGRTFAIVTFKNTGNGDGHSLQASVHTQRDNRGYYLEGQYFDKNNADQYFVDESTGVEYVRQDSTAWKFEYDADKKGYYISNNGKYLYLDPTVDSKNDSPWLNAGNADHDKVHALNIVSDKDTADGGTLFKITRNDDGTYYIGNAQGTYIWDFGGSYWFANQRVDGDNPTDAAVHLCMPEDRTGSHKATLVPAYELSNNQTIVIYQKLWNRDNDEYDFYAIDGNGSLKKVYESSDSLYWMDDPETLYIEWKLIELTDENGKPTGYLRLYNEATGTYLAPKTSGAGYAVVHDAADIAAEDLKNISVSLPGRDSGTYGSRIATWDYDANTTYGIDVAYDPANTSDPYSLNVKELLLSREFLFAIRDPLVQRQLTTVDTVDSVSKGIKISMFDFDYNHSYTESSGNEQRLKYMTEVIGNPEWLPGGYMPGLMSRTLGADGFPTAATTSNHLSLSNVFYPPANATNGFTSTAKGVEDINHLFLQSVYDSTGYFYYSCFDNFAYLPEGSKDFTVYEQIGTPFDSTAHAGENGKDDFFYERGNFMPFNNLDPDRFRANLYEGGDEAKPLNDKFPRKNEDLYVVDGTRDYFFGMIMETKFLQGPEGFSDQGDPMIFEFNGDDDLWVYTDGVLLLDLGGVHDAFHGKINFQTGKITVDIQKTDGRNDTLWGNPVVYAVGEPVTYIKEQYWQAHVFPDGSPWTDRNDSTQNYFFTNDGEDVNNLNAQGEPKLMGTFKDYSSHDLKMFYMERGAGASNLEMQFNLPVLTGEEVRVSKKMLTTATGEPLQSAYTNAAFYYEMYVDKGTVDHPDWQLYTKEDIDALPNGMQPVYDDGKNTPVVWKEGSNTVFEVKPGQTAVIPMASGGVRYKVVEVEPEPGTSHMLDLFKVSNSDEDSDDSKWTKESTVQKRSQVIYDNKPVDDIVNELRITKNLHGNLYRDDTTSTGYVEDQNGSPYFEIRVYLEATGGQLVPYSLGEYYQIDGETGKYVYYDSRKPGKDKRCLAETMLVGGVLNYVYTYADGRTETLQQPKITEHTSQNGSLGDFRPGDTIIIKGLMEGTDFVVDERTDRTHIETSDEGDWDKKYFYYDTDIKDAYIRGTDTALPVFVPDNIDIAGDLFDKPANADDIMASGLFSGVAAAGTIVATKDAEVTVHNKVYNQFEIPLEKYWSEDFSMSELDDNAAVEFTLKRYAYETRSSEFTLNAKVTGAPSGFNPVYTLVNNETEEVFAVRYSDMSGSGDTKSKILTLPVGTYTLLRGDDPDGYDATHTQSANVVTVTVDDAAGNGASASPSHIEINSTYERQVGSVSVTKTLNGYHGNDSFENFTATYRITDSAGNPVKNKDGNTVEPVTLQYSDFTGGDVRTASFTFGDLLSGQYFVKETIASGSYDNERYTVVSTSDPASGLVAVESGEPSPISFTSTYTQVLSDPVRIYVHETAYGRNDTLYDMTTFRPGDKVIISFLRSSYNGDIRYRVNGGNWIQLTNVGPENGGRDIYEVIRMTVPEQGITVEIQDGWSRIKPEHVRVTKDESTLLRSSLAMNAAAGLAETSLETGLMRIGSFGALRETMLLEAASSDSVTAEAENAALPASSANPGKRYVPDDNWELKVSMIKNGALLDSEGHAIGSYTVDTATNKWAVTLAGVDFDGLTADDENGNLYYYYIDRVHEDNVPAGTRPSVDVETDGSLYMYSEKDQENETGRVLSATNELIKAYGDIDFEKADHENAALEGAEFALYRSYTNGVLSNPLQNGGVIVKGISDEQGHVNFSHIPSGTYYMKEVKAPEGFKVSAEVFRVEIVIKAGQEGLENPETETTVTKVADGEVVNTIINEPATFGEVDFIKKDTLGDVLEGAVFTLYNDEACSDALKIHGDVMSAASGNDGRVKFTYTRTLRGETVTGIETGNYYMKETSVPAGFKLNTEKYFVHIGDGTNGDTSFIAEYDEDPELSVGQTLESYYRLRSVDIIENEPVRIIIRKIDENGISLPGAKFMLSGSTAKGDVSVTKPGSGDEDRGEYEFDELLDGTYVIHETAPEGYTAAGPISFRIENGVIKDVNADGNVAFDNRFTFIVTNRPTVNSHEITIRKQWLDFFGNADTPDDINSVDVKIRRYVDTPSTRYLHVTVRVVDTFNVERAKKEQTVAITNQTARVSWEENSQFFWDKNRIPASNRTSSVSSVGITDRTQHNGDPGATAANNTRAVFDISNLGSIPGDSVDVTFTYFHTNSDDAVNQTWFRDTINNATIYIEQSGDAASFGDGTPQPDDSFEDTLTLNASGGWRNSKRISGNGTPTTGYDYPIADANGNAYRYYIVEESVPEGYSVSYSANNSGHIQEGTLTAYNKKTMADITVEKVDKYSGEKLPGAEFSLRKIDSTSVGVVYPEDASRAVKKTTGGADTENFGTAVFKNVEPGYYEIRETGVPDGYIMTENIAFYVRVTEDTITWLERRETSTPAQWEEADGSGYSLGKIVVPNEPGVDLPNSGGPGTTLFHLLGFMLTGIAGAWLVMRKLGRNR